MRHVGKALNEHLWQSVIDTVAEGLVIVNGEGFIRNISVFAAKTLGISRESSIGKHFREVFCPSLPPHQCWVSIGLSNDEKIRGHRFRVERSDGSAYYAIANLTPIKPEGEKPAWAIISIKPENDVEGLAQDGSTQKAIFSSLYEGLITINNEWKITSFNRAAARISGWSEEEVLGRPCKIILTCDSCEDECLVAKAQQEVKPLMNVEMTIRHRRGTEIPLIVNATALFDSDGNAVGAALVLRERDPCLPATVDFSQHSPFFGMIGKSKRMLEIFELIREIADSKSTVLISGENGTGKRLVANAIQKLSDRDNAPYIKVNCAGIPSTLVESQLFGHVEGAFLDAHADRTGAFELANGGTVLLDEVSDLSPPTQYRLLQFLDHGTFQRLGSSETIHSDVRILATTTRDLFHRVQAGKFRDDLFYRLHVIPIDLPPLRDRPEDVPLLIAHFMEKYRQITGKPISEISDAAFDLLTAYPHPGNVREMENIIEHAFTRTSRKVITESKLPAHVRYFSPAAPSPTTPEAKKGEIEEAVRIREALMRCRWNRSTAAKILGLSRTTLWRRMRELNLLDEND